MTKSEFIARLAMTKGKFFSLTFNKKDGSEKQISAQIVRLGDPTPEYLSRKGYVVVRDSNAKRNKKDVSEFVAVHPSKVTELK